MTNKCTCSGCTGYCSSPGACERCCGQSGDRATAPVYTHRKRPYHAECVQWQGCNEVQVMRLLGDGASRFNERYIVWRNTEGMVTLDIGWWVVRGENGVVKCYPDDVFKVKYAEIVVANPGGLACLG